MSIDISSFKQLTIFEEIGWSTVVRVEPNHRLVTLCRSIPWEELMALAVPILYDDHGISKDAGRTLNLRAHLGAYMLQTTYQWTDRWTEEMLNFYIPARIFCGFMDSTGSLDHTSIEEFRNRFGEKGARLITEDMLKVAKSFGLTEPKDLDMDTTVQEAGITYPTEMKLMRHLMKRLTAISGVMKKARGRGISGIKNLSSQFQKILSQYRFFAKGLLPKKKLVEEAKAISENALHLVSKLIPGQSSLEKLQPRYQEELLRLQVLGSQLVDQIGHWLSTGKVACDKIVSLWKVAPKAISKGKIGKPVEFGRKWIVNMYRGGYMLVMAPNQVKLSDTDSVVESLSLHKRVFDEFPKSYGTDRGMGSKQNLELCLSAGIEKIAIQPRGKTKALVKEQDLQTLYNRRAAIEPCIGHLKTRGLGRSKMKSDLGDLISGYRSALSWNLSLLMRDLSTKTMNAPQCFG